MKIGFVTFCTENYTDIMDNLVESVLSFSKYNIIVYSINFEYKHSKLMNTKTIREYSAEKKAPTKYAGTIFLFSRETVYC